MATSEELQEKAKSEYFELLSKKGAVGQFKKIVPMTENIAVAIVKASDGLKAKQDMEHEVTLLKVLKEHGFPVLQTYGDVFEIADAKHAVVMDWVPNANLIDGKAPEMINYLLPALMLGVPINTSNEAWAIQLPQVSKKILAATQNINIAEIQEFARNLSQEISELQRVMDEQKLLIADLQMLITPQGKITIIDPLDVLRIVPKVAPNIGFDLVDILDPSKPNSESFLKSLFKSIEMLDNMKKICDSVAKVKDKQSLQKMISDIMLSHSAPRHGSAPVSPFMPRVTVARNAQSEPSSPRRRLIEPDSSRLQPVQVRRVPAITPNLRKKEAKDDIKAIIEPNIEQPSSSKPKKT